MSGESMYERSPVKVLVTWIGLDQPLPATCRCEVSRLLPQAVFEFVVEVPAELGWREPSWTFFVSTDPGAEVFEVWQQVEDQRWSVEFAWTRDSLRPDDADALGDLAGALSDADAERAFEAFTRLRGGGIECIV